MAFEAFRGQAEARGSTGRKSLWYALSIGFHGALLAVGIAYSFWHIEELSPPLLKVTFLSAAPPPPPAAGPAGGGGAAPKKRPVVKPKLIVQPKQEIVQPRETPKPQLRKEEPVEEPKPQHDDGKGSGKGTIGGAPDGTPGGSANGKIGGTIGATGSGAPTGAPKFLPPNVAMAQKIAGNDPPFPVSLRKPGAVYHVLTKFCVSQTGGVDKVTIMKSADSLLDGGLVDELKRNWRFRPYLVNGTPQPICTVYDFVFKTQ